MKLIINNGRIVATVTDNHQNQNGEIVISADADFDIVLLDAYRYVDGVLVVPYVKPSTEITKLAFRNRFTQAEKVTLELASLDDPTAIMEIRQQSALLRATLSDLAAATIVDTEDESTIEGVQLMETVGLIGNGRAAAILGMAAPILITPEEQAALASPSPTPSSGSIPVTQV